MIFSKKLFYTGRVPISQFGKISFAYMIIDFIFINNPDLFLKPLLMYYDLKCLCSDYLSGLVH